MVGDPAFSDVWKEEILSAHKNATPEQTKLLDNMLEVQQKVKQDGRDVPSKPVTSP